MEFRPCSFHPHRGLIFIVISAVRLCRKHCKYLRKLYIIFQCSRCMRPSRTAVKNVLRIPLENWNKFTFLSSETSRPSTVVDFRTLFMLLTKGKFTHLFQKRVPYKIQRSFVFRSHTSLIHAIAYTYTKNVTPGNKTLGSHLNIFQLWKIWLRLRIMQIDKDTLRIKGARQNYLCKLCNL